jgi:hypothetical protein
MVMRFRRSLPIALGLGIAALIPTIVHAQVGIGGGGGVTFPVGKFHTAYANGFNLLTTIDLHAPGVPLGFRIDGMYDRFRGNESVFGSAPPHAQIWTINANVVANLENEPGASIIPYVIGGAGYYNSSFDNFTTGVVTSPGITIPAPGSTHTGNFGVNGGIGVRLDVGAVRLFVEGRYHYVLGHAQVRLMPFSAGVTLGG